MNNNKGQHECHPMPINPDAKVQHFNDMCKCLEYFRYTTGTSLDCANATGVLRNSITWYVAELEAMNLLKAVAVKADRTTQFKAKHYSANPDEWQRASTSRELSLFDDSEPHGECNVSEVADYCLQRIKARGGKI